MIKLIMPAVLETWKEEDEKMVATQICVELRAIMKDVGPAVVVDCKYENYRFLSAPNIGDVCCDFSSMLCFDFC